MNYFKHLSEYELKEIIPGFFGQFIHGENMTIVFWKVKEGSPFPEHKHIHEQIATVQKGRFELTVDGNSKILDTGVVAVIPSNTIHSGKAITDCELIDIFYPVREDYRER